jgi:hypothetical protein
MTCKHQCTSLVEAEVEGYGSILTVQCDLCGMQLPNIHIPDATIDAWNQRELKAPTIDDVAYDSAISRAVRQVFSSKTVALEQFVKMTR